MTDKSIPPTMIQKLAREWIEVSVQTHQRVKDPEGLLKFAKWLDKFIAGEQEDDA
jgi:hypothetical protein